MKNFYERTFNHDLDKRTVKSKVVLKYSLQFLVHEGGENPHTDPPSIKSIKVKWQ